jgi:TonB family protein
MSPSNRILGVRMMLILASFSLLGAAPEKSPKKRTKEPDFWSKIIDPGRQQAEKALERGRKIYDSIVRDQRRLDKSPQLKRRLLEDALAAFSEACRASPRNTAAWFFKGRVLMDLERMKPAIAALRRARRLDASYNAYSLAFDLGIAYSKTGSFERAVLEYDRAERVLLASGERLQATRGRRSVLNGNAAEALMALGRLDEAIQRYREALSQGGANRTLIRWGLAVAYDRDEQVSKAMAEARAAITADPGMRELTRDSVFFIPQGDIHYYFGLGNLVQGKVEESKKHWQMFLDKLPKNQWAFRARAHLAELGVATSKKKPRKGRLAPVPRQTVDRAETAARDRMSIRYRVQGYIYRIRRCYQRELKRKRDLTGRLRLSFVVTAAGKVTRATVRGSTVGRPSLHKCVLGVIRGIPFSRPASRQAVKVSFPIAFKP